MLRLAYIFTILLSKAGRRGRPWRLVFEKEFANVELARQWEQWVKQQKSRRIVEEIISGSFDWER